MALLAGALTTYATVKSELGLADDTNQTAVERCIEVATAAIEQYCNRTFGAGTVTNEKHAPTGTRYLALERAPLSSITSVVWDGSTIAAADYAIDDADAGLLLFDYTLGESGEEVSGSTAVDEIAGTSERNILVTYVGGYVLPSATSGRNLPYDLEQAVITTAVSQYRQRGRDLLLASESLGPYSYSLGGLNTAIGRGMGGIIPDTVIPILERYRRIIL